VGDKSRMKKGPGSVYDKRNIYMDICDTYITVNQVMVTTVKLCLSSPPVFSGVRVTRSFMCMSCRSLSVLLYFFFWPLCCLFLVITLFTNCKIPITDISNNSGSVKELTSGRMTPLGTNSPKIEVSIQ
jgi:hypothetical protein